MSGGGEDGCRPNQRRHPSPGEWRALEAAGPQQRIGQVARHAENRRGVIGTAAPFLSPTYLKIPQINTQPKSSRGPTLPAPPPRRTASPAASVPPPALVRSSLRQFREDKPLAPESHCVRTAEVYGAPRPSTSPLGPHTILLSERRAKDPALEAASLILLAQWSRHQINTGFK